MLRPTSGASETMDYIGPAIGAVLFVVCMQWVREPTCRTFDAAFVSGACPSMPPLWAPSRRDQAERASRAWRQLPSP